MNNRSDCSRCKELYEYGCKFHYSYNVTYGHEDGPCGFYRPTEEPKMEENKVEQVENLEEQPSTSKQGAQVQLPMDLVALSDILKTLKESGVKKFNVGGVILGEF